MSDRTLPVPQMLREAAAVFEERNLVYKDAYRKVGPIMEALFPDGVKLAVSEDHNRFHILMLIVVKLTRYSSAFDGGHPDSITDISTYAAMLAGLDREMIDARTEAGKPVF